MVSRIRMAWGRGCILALFCLLFALEPGLQAQVPPPGNAAPAASFRFFNALNYENEVRVFLDDEVLVSNMLPGEFSSFSETKPGSHRLVIQDRYSEKKLFEGPVEVAGSGYTTAVVWGTPEDSAVPPKAVSLHAAVSRKKADKQDEKAKSPLLCDLTFLNVDYIGNVSLKITALNQKKEAVLAPGKEMTVSDWPVASLSQEGLARINRESDTVAPLSTMLFSPAKEAAYFCFYYRAPQAGATVQAIYLQGNEDGNYGYHESDDRPPPPKSE